MLESLTKQLRTGQALTPEQVSAAIIALTEEQVLVEPKADFLAALATKGETVDEIAAFARELGERSILPSLDTETRGREILDVCGTGGDKLNTFNISTTVALVAAAAGVTLAKHGNRAITSQSGSADVLEELGVRIDLGPEEAARCLKERGFAFFFAPKYHPAFRHIGPARKLCAERGQRTIFNFLGPLLNPARPSAQLVGVPRPELCEPMGRVLQTLGVRRAMVVCGSVPDLQSPSSKLYLDELSTLGKTTVAEFYQDHAFALSTIEAENFPLRSATLGDLRGGDRVASAAMIRALLDGRERGPQRDTVLLNSAAALFVAGRARSISEGWDLAAKVIDGGAAQAKLAQLTDPI